jgi:hypothetical protein
MSLTVGRRGGTLESAVGRGNFERDLAIASPENLNPSRALDLRAVFADLCVVGGDDNLVLRAAQKSGAHGLKPHRIEIFKRLTQGNLLPHRVFYSRYALRGERTLYMHHPMASRLDRRPLR